MPCFIESTLCSYDNIGDNVDAADRFIQIPVQFDEPISRLSLPIEANHTGAVLLMFHYKV